MAGYGIDGRGRHLGSGILGDQVIGRRQGGIDQSPPASPGGREWDAKAQRIAPGVEGEIEVAVRAASGESPVNSEGQGATGRREVRLARLRAAGDFGITN